MRAILVSLLFLVGCPQGEGLLLGTAPEEDCDLTLDGLADSTWVMYEPIYERGSVENPQARLRFEQGEDTLTAQYTVKSLSDVYDYVCEPGEERVTCREELSDSHLLAWCRALEAHEQGACTRRRLRELGATGIPQEKVDEAVATGRREAADLRGGPEWDHFVLRNNNLGNKLRLVLHVRVDERRCRLRVTDNYLTIHDGRSLEDSNPGGTTPFVQHEGELLWETCTDGRNLLDLAEAERPEDLSAVPAERVHPIGTEVHYHYVGETAVEPEEGCTYSKDVYAQWERVAEGVPVEATDDRLDWRASHTWTDLEALELVSPAQPTGVLTLVRYQQCGDADREQIDLVCSAAFFEPRPRGE